MFAFIWRECALQEYNNVFVQRFFVPHDLLLLKIRIFALRNGRRPLLSGDSTVDIFVFVFILFIFICIFGSYELRFPSIVFNLEAVGPVTNMPSM